MERQQIEESIIEFVKKINGSEVNIDEKMSEYLDSLDIVELSMKCEYEFGININDDEWEQAETFKDCCDIIEKLI